MPIITPPPGPIARPLTEDEWVWLHSVLRPGDPSRPPIRAMCHLWSTGHQGGMVDTVFFETMRSDGRSADWRWRTPLINNLEHATGFRFEMFGPPITIPEDLSQAPRPFYPIHGPETIPWAEWPYNGLRMQLNYGWMDGSPGFAEMRWVEGWTAEAWSTGGFSWPPTPTERSAARKALDYLQLRVKGPGGRPKGTRKGMVWPRQRYLDWYPEASRFGEPTLAELADKMGVTEGTVRTRLSAPDVALPWPPESHRDIWAPDDF